MAEKKKYNSILVSGRKDETLTHTKYIKDEESGESVKESLDKKVNITDELTTQQIKDGAITNEKIAASSVTIEKIKDKNVTNEKLADNSVSNEKIKDKSITNSKLGDNSVDERNLSNSSVENRHIRNNAVSTSKIASRSVTNEKIAYNSVSRAELTPDVRSSIDKKADAEQVNNSLYNLEKKIGDRFVVEGDVTNLPDEEDLTSVKESEHDVLKLADRSYAPYNFSGKGYKILRKNIKQVSLAVTTIVVSAVPTSDGYMSFIINGVESHVDVVASSDTTTDKVAGKIAEKLTETMTEYEVSKDASTITLTRKFGGSVTPSVFSASTTDIVCTITDSTKQEPRNILTPIMMNQPNTIYEIRYDFDLNDETIEMQEGCTLKFCGGSINNGTIIEHNLNIIGNQAVFRDLYIECTGTVVLSDFTCNYSYATKHIVVIKESEHVLIENLSINIDEHRYRYYEANGFSIYNSKNIKISNTKINNTKSNYTHSLQGAIFIENSSEITITNCSAIKAKAECLATHNCNNVKYYKCKIIDCDGSAICTGVGNGLIIDGCTIENTGASGISINSTNINICNNTIKNNKIFNAITIGHIDMEAGEVNITNNFIETDFCGIGGVIYKNVLITHNHIKCNNFTDFDVKPNDRVCLTLKNNIVYTNGKISRFSLPNSDIYIGNNMFYNIKLEGYCTNSNIFIQDNHISDCKSHIINFSSKQNSFILSGNNIYNCDFSAQSGDFFLMQIVNTNQLSIKDNKMIDTSEIDGGIYFFNIEEPDNIQAFITNNDIIIKKQGVTFRTGKENGTNKKFVLVGNTSESENKSYLFYRDSNTEVHFRNNTLNNQYVGENPNGSVEPDQILLYDESSFSRIQSKTTGVVFNDIHNNSPVKGTKALDFSYGKIIYGDVNLQNTRILPMGCDITDFIKGQITGTYKEGQILYDKELKKMKLWNGSVWVNIDGTELASTTSN